MIVLIMSLIVVAMAIPSVVTISRNYRIGGDTRAIAAQLNVARMRAAAEFSHARVYMDLQGNTFHLEVWNKGSACWQTDGDTNACTQISSPVISLSSGDAFGFGSITSGPTAATSTTAQAPACRAGVAGTSPGTSTSKTACIEFNSRGNPVDSSNSIVASDAIYITNNLTSFSAIGVSISGQPSEYRYTGSSWAQF